MASEQIADTGYSAIKVEATKGTAVTPNIYLPYFSANIQTNQNVEDIDPIVGNKFMRFGTIRGLRDFMGEVVWLGEPNILSRIFDMFLTQGSITGGSDPYTHPFTLSNTTNPKSYTLDIAKGRVVHRFFGVEVSSIGFEFDANRVKVPCSVSALGSFQVAYISSVNSTELTLSSEYSSTPSKGLVASDLVRIFKADGSVVDTTVSSLTDTTVTVASASGVAGGDYLCLRPATPSYTLSDYLQWAKIQLLFGTSASAAASNSQTRVDEFTLKLMHEFLPNEGAKRTGSHDPAALIRGRADAEFTIKKFFDTPDDQSLFLQQTKQAVIIRMVANSNHKVDITLNNLVQAENPVDTEVSGVLFNQITYKPRYDTSDAHGMQVSVVNAISS